MPNINAKRNFRWFGSGNEFGSWHDRRTKVTFEKVEGSEIPFSSTLRTRKNKIKSSFYMLRSGPNGTRPQLVFGYNKHTKATCYGLDDPGIGSRWKWVFPHLLRPALTSTQPPIEWVPDLFPGVKAAEALRWTFTRSRAEVTERVELYF